MRKLLDFLLKYNYWLLFILLEVASFTLLFRFNRYQQGAFFTSANLFAGKVYEMQSSITSYFDLKTINKELMDRNLELELQLSSLQKQLTHFQQDRMQIDSLMEAPLKGVQFIDAMVINNSLTSSNNYLTLNKGSDDGVKSGMGVIGRNGVVGIVYLTTSGYSVVISLLNEQKSRISCKIANTGYFGTLSWKPGDSRFAYLEGIPRHARFKRGGRIVTSGYSEVFPEGVSVGKIGRVTESKDGLSYRLQVALSTDFGNLTDVRIVATSFSPERSTLEETANRTDGN